MKQSLKIIFFGNEKIATGVESEPLVFKALLKSSHEVVALVVKTNGSKSRNKRKEPIIELAEAQNVPILNPTNIKDIKHDISRLNADCGVLVAYGKIIPEDIISIFPRGIINLHPSLLPNLRGSTPVETAILSGLNETGVSIMSLAKEMDAGPIYAQVKLSIPEGISKQDLATMLHSQGSSTMIDVLDNIDNTTAKAQNEDYATFTSQISKHDGIIDWTKSATLIEREIRAFAGWPRSITNISGFDVIVTAAHAESSGSKVLNPGEIHIDNVKKSIKVETSEGFLFIDTIQPVGRKEMEIASFINGYIKNA
ncbi:methionyl-tRNA formyltransferase [Candidatus Saccharibacteria bacterium]|nr:methionyl-tRNA formyltransferase [Candidatus Saccharibacteria bacterium]